jgi:DNA-binding transcriptional MerR regulator
MLQISFCSMDGAKIKPTFMNYLMPNMEQFSIKDLERLSGINAHTIRVWERRYNLIEPGRTDTNRRLYSDDDLRRIINIAILNRSGLKISKIACLGNAGIDSKVSELLSAPIVPTTEIDAMILAMMALDSIAVKGIMMRSELERGFDETVKDMVFPFMVRIGVMWQTGTIGPGYEHFMTNIFRNRIINAIECITENLGHTAKRVLLYLPEGELHELSLLLYAYLIRKAGHDILYLGQTTPADSVISVSQAWKPDIIVTGASTALPPAPLKYLTRLSQEMSESKILIAGILTSIKGATKISNIVPVHTPAQLLKALG